MAYHTFITVVIPAFIAFLATIAAVKFLSPYFYDAGIVAEDRNKEKLFKLPGSGGVTVAFGVTFGILAYIFGVSFIFSSAIDISNLFATSLAIALIATVGFIDDLNVKQKRVQVTGMKGINKGLKQWQKPILTALGALPLIAINAGVSTVHLPFLGAVHLGILYPLIIIPLAVIFAANAYNLLGGFNGLESAMGLVAGLGLLVYSLLYGNAIGVLLSSVLSGALLGFLIFNWYPASILPGDSLTYCIGGALVAIMIMGNAESFGIVIFLPWIAEFILHARKKFKVSDLGIRQKDGTLKPPYGKSIYSLTHLMMNIRRCREMDVTIMLAAVEVAFVAAAILLKMHGIL